MVSGDEDRCVVIIADANLSRPGVKADDVGTFVDVGPAEEDVVREFLNWAELAADGLDDFSRRG